MVGRFNESDAKASHPKQVDKSTYAYAWNSPINFTDPDGNCPICPPVLGAATGAALEYGVQVVTNLYDGKGLKSFTDVDGKSIGVAAGLGAVGGGLLKSAGKLFQLIRFGKKTDEIINVSSKVADEVAGVVSKVEEFADPKFANQLARNFESEGVKSINSSFKSLTKNIAKHESKINEVRKTGGFTSSMEREVNTFKKQLETINQFIERNNIKLK